MIIDNKSHNHDYDDTMFDSGGAVEQKQRSLSLGQQPRGELMRISFVDKADRYFTTTDNYDQEEDEETNKKRTPDMLTKDLLSDIASSGEFCELKTADNNKEVSEREFLLRHTLSYWVSIFFMLGSCYFIIGGFGQIYKLGADDRRDGGSFVDTPFLVGGTAYLFGCYCGFWAVINLDRKDPVPKGRKYHKFRFFAYEPSLGGGYWSQLCYSIGATSFSFGLVLTDQEATFFSVGSLFFTFGASYELSHNHGLRFRPSRLGWWISWSDTMGSVLFLIGALNMYPGVIAEWEKLSVNGQVYASDLSFLLGSFFFLFSSLGGLWMWKLEQFGNTYLPRLNITQPYHITSAKRSVKGYHLFFTLVYCCNITLATVNISLAIRCDLSQLPGMVLRILIPAGLLVVSSVIHMIPEGPPFSYLLWWLRMSMFYQLMVDALETGHICKEYDSQRRLI
jgi:hypothetical protein